MSSHHMKSFVRGRTWGLACRGRGGLGVLPIACGLQPHDALHERFAHTLRRLEWSGGG